MVIKLSTSATIYIAIDNRDGQAGVSAPTGFINMVGSDLTFSHGSDSILWPVYFKKFSSAGKVKFALKKGRMAAVFLISDGLIEKQCDWTVDAQSYKSIYMGAKTGDKYTGVKSLDGKRSIPGLMSMWVRNQDAIAVPATVSQTSGDTKELNWKIGGTTSNNNPPRVEIKNLNKFAKEEMGFSGADSGFDEFTVAFHFKAPESNKAQTPISYATSKHNNNMLVYNINKFSAYMGNGQGSAGTGFADNQWHSACWTWSKSSGKTVSWIDGKKYVGTSSGSYVKKALPSDGTFVLGQEQDRVGSGFDKNQAYEGSLTRVNVYSTYATEVECGSSGTWLKTGASGDVANWDKIVEEVAKTTDCTDAIDGKICTWNSPKKMSLTG
jgi:hypothetical protein